jgi:hypothetical protein
MRVDPLTATKAINCLYWMKRRNPCIALPDKAGGPPRSAPMSFGHNQDSHYDLTSVIQSTGTEFEIIPNSSAVYIMHIKMKMSILFHFPSYPNIAAV